MSLYRTYRPKAFSDVVGQEHVVQTLENAVTLGNIAHAYLFAGARGTGKTSVARIMARAILTGGIEDEKLREQVSKGVEEGTIVDCIEIDAASNRGIDDIRTLIERIQFSPVMCNAKVYIIDEVHMLTKEAFNALLKTLEEPPPYAYFILATTELQKIPGTIQSRCQRFTFRQIQEDDIIRRLQFIADKEHITADRGALRSIAHHAQGGLRDAVALLDQLRTVENITAEDVRERIGESPHEYVESLMAALQACDHERIVLDVRKAEEAGLSLEHLARGLLSQMRVNLHKAVEEGQDPTPHTTRMEGMLTALRDLRNSPLPGLVLEASLMRLCLGSAPTTIAKVPETRKSAKAAAKAKEDSPPPTPERAPEPPVTEAPKQDATVEAPELTLDAVAAVWPTMVNEMKPASVKMSLKNGSVVAIDRASVTVSFASRFHRDRVASREATFGIEEALQQLFKRPLRLLCVVEEERKAMVSDQKAVDLAEAAAEVF